MTQSLFQTPLSALHRELGAKMVPFAGYEMPLQYEGIVKEHQHTRQAAGLFDVSHMGQAYLKPAQGADPGQALELLVPGAIAALKPGRMRYTLLLNEDGGILDDLMAARTECADGRLFLVVNAARKAEDFTLIAETLAGKAELEVLDGRALIALQGPQAEAALARHLPKAAGLSFMQMARLDWQGEELLVSRSGYTGEDGFEISVPAAAAERFARALLDEEAVAPAGLGARDSLRLEAGLCLYGHDIDATTTPVEADLVFALSKARRERGDFPGADRILQQLAAGPVKRRVGLKPAGRTIAREGAEIFAADGETRIGTVTSGGFGPSVGGAVAMGYVTPDHAQPGTPVKLSVRTTLHDAEVAPMPFVPRRYKRKTSSP